MAAVIAHFARDQGLKLKLQLLTVPATDMRYCPTNVNGKLDVEACKYQSVVFCADAPWGPVGRESWFLNYFIGTEPGMPNHICPFFPTDNWQINEVESWMTGE